MHHDKSSTFIICYNKTMNLTDKIERSKSTERIDYSKIGCLQLNDALVKVEPSERISIEPFWTIDGDFEGRMYTDYMAEHPEYDGVYVRPELLIRLEKVANSLAEEFRLVIRAGHRPIEIQRRLLRECAQDYKDDNPGVSDQEAFEHASTFVSDPDTSLPPHCCGSAIDVDLFDVTKNSLVDFGSPVNLDDDISFLHYNQITSEQKQNRLMLLSVMLEQDFASTAFEWWHFSYGDETWAWFYGLEDSLYGLIEI
jgi:D-alanyl-D-alanine dipeptidase